MNQSSKLTDVMPHPVYVDMGLSSNSPVVLTVVTAGASYSRSFSIKVTQIECDSLSKAANGCLQYYQVPP